MKKGISRVIVLCLLILIIAVGSVPLLGMGRQNQSLVSVFTPDEEDPYDPNYVGNSASALSYTLSQSMYDAMDALQDDGNNAVGVDVMPEHEISGIPQVESDKPYMIVIYIGSQRVVVYEKDENGSYTVPAYVFTVSTGLGNNTPRGTFRVAYRWRWLPMHGIYCQYVTQWYGDYLFHSVMYATTNPATLDRSAYTKLGSKASLGCIRMPVRDAKWIYDNVESGTYVISTTDEVPEGTPGSRGVPALTLDCRWEPTDPDPNNPYLALEQEAVPYDGR